MRKNNTPLISIIVVMTGDTITASCSARNLALTLDALEPQRAVVALEIIVPYHKFAEGIDELSKAHPKVKFLYIDDMRFHNENCREHHDELRARGVREAKGQIIAFLEDSVVPRFDWAKQIISAHESRTSVIGGAIENGIDTPLHWANYLCDLGKYQNPVPTGQSPCASLVNASYKRQAIDSIEYVWHERFNETIVNHALNARGDTIILSRHIVVTHGRAELDLRLSLKEFHVWGRSYAKSRAALVGAGYRIIYIAFAAMLPLLLTARIARRALSRGTRTKFLKALPFILALATSWSVGEFRGYIADSGKYDFLRLPRTPDSEEC